MFFRSFSVAPGHKVTISDPRRQSESAGGYFQFRRVRLMLERSRFLNFRERPTASADFLLGAQNCNRIPKTRVLRFWAFYPHISAFQTLPFV